jgi:hypothetical protein
MSQKELDKSEFVIYEQTLIPSELILRKFCSIEIH